MTSYFFLLCIGFGGLNCESHSFPQKPEHAMPVLGQWKAEVQMTADRTAIGILVFELQDGHLSGSWKQTGTVSPPVRLEKVAFDRGKLRFNLPESLTRDGIAFVVEFQGDFVDDNAGLRGTVKWGTFRVTEWHAQKIE